MRLGQALLLVLLWTTRAAAQTPTAEVAGTVIDADSGRPVSGVLVTLPELERGAITDALGHYALGGVPTGPRHLVAQSIGYEPCRLHALVPRTGRLVIDISLAPRPIPLAPLTVHAPIELPTAGRVHLSDREASIAAIEAHPLMNEPDVFGGLAAGEASLTQESPAGLFLRGGAADQTAYVLDGIPILSPFHAGGMGSAWNPDAVSRLRLREEGCGLDAPLSLAGAVEGHTRSLPGSFGARGGASTTQARITADLPTAREQTSLLVSARWGLPDLLPGAQQSTYLRGQTGDRLFTLDLPLAQGELHLLGYGSDNELRSVAGVPRPEIFSGRSPRNHFEWESSSLGASWARRIGARELRVIGWSALAQAGSSWIGDTGDLDLGSERRELGLLASMKSSNERGGSELALRAEMLRTGYHTDGDSLGAFRARGRLPLLSAYAARKASLSPSLSFESGSAPRTSSAGPLVGGGEAAATGGPNRKTGSRRRHEVASNRSRETAERMIYLLEGLEWSPGASPRPRSARARPPISGDGGRVLLEREGGAHREVGRRAALRRQDRLGAHAVAAGGDLGQEDAAGRVVAGVRVVAAIHAHVVRLLAHEGDGVELAAAVVEGRRAARVRIADRRRRRAASQLGRGEALIDRGQGGRLGGEGRRTGQQGAEQQGSGEDSHRRSPWSWEGAGRNGQRLCQAVSSGRGDPSSDPRWGRGCNFG